MITFAQLPKQLDPDSWGDNNKPIGSCTGYHPEGCTRGFASSDIFFLEVCFYSMMCANRAALFRLAPWEDWRCEMDWEGYAKMRDMIAHPAKPDV